MTSLWKMTQISKLKAGSFVEAGTGIPLNSESPSHGLTFHPPGTVAVGARGLVAELPSNLARGLSGRRDFGPRMGGTLSTLSTHSTLTTRASIGTFRFTQ